MCHYIHETEYFCGHKTRDRSPDRSCNRRYASGNRCTEVLEPTTYQKDVTRLCPVCIVAGGRLPFPSASSGNCTLS
ncbi:hypothetical protein Dda_5184 [Drechslerella dactyloides]|uniref:Uncharacterized protein n=1 Tax=Drechslerella dactyloides TaxID=74499 RepID=A0AAD6IWB6_DREDA|nr:hypothetical protein Dda_5184 [Drechslerella dactyloides]